MFKNITLELSFKAFKETSDEYIRGVCRRIFQQWHALLKNRESISVMLWVGDGCELFDYTGDLDAEFEWCRFVGTANLPHLAPDEPLETSLHKRRQDYMPNAPKMTYRILKKIIACLKEEGKRAFPNAKIRVGETFDIGPEFAISDFKYRRHREICSGAAISKLGIIDSTACLASDTYPYAAFPQGVSDGLPFGSFFGAQAEVFLRDMDFDYLWLSNGLGFSANPWDMTGKIFDGENYYPEKLADTKKKVFDFWKLFREKCSYPLETRGTNNSVGIDYATDAVPLYDIYSADLDITAPPNSPWAALNDNYGLEIMGHMTRICELPNEKFPFRYYLHDPWWLNSPWYDRYDNSPCDIYLPMSISRINAEGKTEAANSLNILSIDNSHGDMPDACVNEPLPHILKAEKDIADEPAPLVWVYPMREYTTSTDAELLREMNLGDRYICDSINDGVPLNCVVSTDQFLRHTVEIYQKSILISPVPENPAVLEQLAAFSEKGIGVILYGTKKKLAPLSADPRFVCLFVDEEGYSLREALRRFGYQISFVKIEEGIKPPTMGVARHDNGFFFSVYNANTTTGALLKFPLGAPVLCGMEAEMKDGSALYRFNRGDHRECRIFATQKDGFISCREAPTGNVRYRRALRIQGLRDATLCLFPEKGCETAVSLGLGGASTPVADERFTLVHDECYGTYLKGEHISGSIYFMMERKKS